MTWVDRAISAVAPTYALRRMAARNALRMGAAYYQGAKASRLNYNWSTGQESADTTLSDEIQTLRNRSRDLNRNNAIASGITGTLTVNTVKTGLRPQARIRPDRVPLDENGIRRFQQDAERIYEQWSPWADARCQLTFEEIQSLAVRQIVESGEFLTLRRALKTDNGRPFMLALDIMEPDRLETPGQARLNPQVRFGIEQNSFGAPVAYHIRKTHPGDTFYRPRQDATAYTRIPARDPGGRPLVLHVYPVLRPGQTRGVPFFAPVIDQFKILADYIEAELVAARVAACFAAFIKTDDPYAAAVGRSEDTNDNSQRLEALEPGMVEYLGQNQDVTFANPNRPGDTFDAFVERILRMIGASLGLPYELVIKDFSKTNYSSARAALLQAYRVFQVWQQMLVNHLCQPVWELLVEEAWLRGRLVAPGFEKYKWEYTRALWIPPGWQWVDPLKEVDANTQAVRMGFKTRADVCAEQGDDWEAKAEQMAREKAVYEELGLVWNAESATKTADKGGTRKKETPNES
jgi:lambda family phage portal protein